MAAHFAVSRTASRPDARALGSIAGSGLPKRLSLQAKTTCLKPEASLRGGAASADLLDAEKRLQVLRSYLKKRFDGRDLADFLVPDAPPDDGGQGKR